MKTLLTIFILGLLTSCTTTTYVTGIRHTTKNKSNTTNALQINFDELKNDSSSTIIYLKIDDKKVELYTISSDGGRDMKRERELTINDEVHNIIASGQTTSNDEVCIDGDAVAKITLYNFNDEIIKTTNSVTKCILVREIRETGYKFVVEKKNRDSLTIYIDKGEESKNKDVD